MKYFRIFLLVALAALCTTNAEAKVRNKKKTEPVVTTIYAFGISQNLSDSTVYVTAIAPINGATILPNKLLQNRQYYSEQLQKYVETTYGLTHQTSTFFFSTKRKKVEKTYQKVQVKMKKRMLHKVTFKEIPSADFHYRVPVVVESSSEY